jgi:hypothetical protein
VLDSKTSAFALPFAVGETNTRHQQISREFAPTLTIDGTTKFRGGDWQMIHWVKLNDIIVFNNFWNLRNR